MFPDFVTVIEICADRPLFLAADSGVGGPASEISAHVIVTNVQVYPK